jgi:hypothetical protein
MMNATNNASKTNDNNTTSSSSSLSAPSNSSGRSNGTSTPRRYDENSLPELKDVPSIPNLSNIITIPSSLSIFQTNPELGHLVTLGVDRAVNKVIQSVIDRAASIAKITTQKLVVKDFAMEPDGEKVRKSSQALASYLASHLASVNAREILTKELHDNFLHLFSRVALDDRERLEAIANTCTEDNLVSASTIIEQAAHVKSQQDVEEVMVSHIQARRRRSSIHSGAMGTGNSARDEESKEPFVDEAVLYENPRFPSSLPPSVWPSSPGLAPFQLELYSSLAAPHFSAHMSYGNTSTTNPSGIGGTGGITGSGLSSGNLMNNVGGSSSSSSVTPLVPLENPPSIVKSMDATQLSNALEKHLQYLVGLSQRAILAHQEQQSSSSSSNGNNNNNSSSSSNEPLTLSSLSPNSPLFTYYRDFTGFIRSSPFDPSKDYNSLLIPFCQRTFQLMLSYISQDVLICESLIGVLEAVKMSLVSPSDEYRQASALFLEAIFFWMMSSF